jgi:molecular chaperone GrpE
MEEIMETSDQGAEVQETEVAAEGELAPDLEAEGAAAETDVQALLEALEAARQRAEEYQNDMLRVRAEMDNLRKRSARDLENAHKFALERFITELLPVQDSLELGFQAAQKSCDTESLRQGVDLTLKMLVAALEKSGVKTVDPAGEKFNPEFHQAMSMQESDGAEPGTVLMVVQKGYLLNGRLIRPAMVIVAK